MQLVYDVKFIDPNLADTPIVASRYEVDADGNFVRFFDHQNHEILAIVFGLVLAIRTRGHAATVTPHTDARGPLASVPSNADLAVGTAADAGAMRPAPVPPARLPVEGAAAAAAANAHPRTA